MHELIDLGSTHSFMSHALDRSSGVKTKPMGCSMVISTPMGKNMKTLETIEECKISQSNIQFQAHLILLEVYDFDIILVLLPKIQQLKFVMWGPLELDVG